MCVCNPHRWPLKAAAEWPGVNVDAHRPNEIEIRGRRRASLTSTPVGFKRLKEHLLVRNCASILTYFCEVGLCKTTHLTGISGSGAGIISLQRERVCGDFYYCFWRKLAFTGSIRINQLVSF
jgi:hypothetical protein